MGSLVVGLEGEISLGAKNSADAEVYPFEGLDDEAEAVDGVDRKCEGGDVLPVVRCEAEASVRAEEAEEGGVNGEKEGVVRAVAAMVCTVMVGERGKSKAEAKMRAVIVRFHWFGSMAPEFAFT